MTFNSHTLPNGLRIIHQHTSSKVAYCGFAINAGTRDELAHEHGMAHFIEHLLFKGTRKHKAWYILNRMERVGADLNAYTNKEETMVHAAFLTEHFARAVELLSDIVFESVFPQGEIGKEAEVVIDEIRSYEDNPAELIFDDFENMIFHDHALGHHILGSIDSLKSFDQARINAFYTRYYHPSNAVFFVSGDISLKKVLYHVEKATRHLASATTENTRTAPVKALPQRIEIHKDTYQAHVMMGCQAFDAHSDKRTTLYLINNLLGGPGMNSRLNVALRERRGLAYNVESNLTAYTDTGAFSIYFGTDPERTEQCLRIIIKELKRLCDTALTSSQLQAVKKQMIGQIAVASDNNESNALGMGKTFLHYNKFETPDAVFKRIEAITTSEVLQVANEILDMTKMSTIVYK